MVMLTPYFDGSGDNKSDRGIVTVGGYIGDVRAWARYEKRWRAVLDSEGIEHFHMTDFVSGVKGFERFRNRPDLQADVLSRLIPVVLKNTRRSFATSVLLADWHAVNADYRLKECRLTPYAMAAFSVTDKTMRWIGKVKNRGFTEFVFEKGDNGQGDFMWWVDQVLAAGSETQRRVFKEAGFYPQFKPKGFLPLQACDFAMWEKRKGTQQIYLADQSPVRRELLALLKGPRTWGVLSRERVVEWAEKFGVPKRDDPTWNRRTWRPSFYWRIRQRPHARGPS